MRRVTTNPETSKPIMRKADTEMPDILPADRGHLPQSPGQLEQLSEWSLSQMSSPHTTINNEHNHSAAKIAPIEIS